MIDRDRALVASRLEEKLRKPCTYVQARRKKQARGRRNNNARARGHKTHRFSLSLPVESLYCIIALSTCAYTAAASAPTMALSLSVRVCVCAEGLAGLIKQRLDVYVRGGLRVVNICGCFDRSVESFGSRRSRLLRSRDVCVGIAMLHFLSRVKIEGVFSRFFN